MKQNTNLGRSLCLLFAGVGVAAALPAAAGTCTINVTANSQTIDGFGFSSAWSGSISAAEGNVLFGTSSGQLGFSLLRVRIDPTESWSQEAGNASIAHGHGAKVLGTPWTPPASMKSNDNIVGGTLNTSEYSAYASYLNSAAGEQSGKSKSAGVPHWRRWRGGT